ncbi:MAG: GNAT family protein [Saprospiraceae bacterium]|nr:GNAT family protein [Saprospiraceae bacterium]
MDYSVFDSFPILETSRLLLQAYEVQDVNDIYLLNSDSVIMTYLDKAPAKNKVEILTKIKAIQKDFEEHRGINWTIKMKGSSEVIAYFGMWRIDHTNHRAEIGYALKPDYWRKGIIHEAACEVFDFAFNKLQVHSIMANINPANIASERLLKKLGFQKEAHFREDYFYDGKYLDSVIYCLLTSDWS